MGGVDGVRGICGEECGKEVAYLGTSILNLVLPVRELYLEQGDTVLICMKGWVLV